MTTITRPTIAPFEGDISPILFGVEHEYAGVADERECDNDCHCYDCQVDGYCTCDEDDYGFGGFDGLPDDWDQHAEHCGWEVKTPPSTDVALVVATFDEVRSQHDGNHHDCGLHVHLNADPRRGQAVNPALLHRNWVRHRDTLWAACPNPNGTTGITGGRYYAAAVPDDTAHFLADRDTRYRELNTVALRHHTTMEVRLAAATADINALERWLRLVIAVGLESVYTDDPLTELGEWVGPGRYGAELNIVGMYLTQIGVDPVAVRAIATRRI